jgi:L,D-peptidoglycan transpeptidase YkuD (ErfK/YbiS/YcfS/YnhG family)
MEEGITNEHQQTRIRCRVGRAGQQDVVNEKNSATAAAHYCLEAAVPRM